MEATQANPQRIEEIPELILKRQLKAPRSLVWKVWTDANHLAHWWGPKGFTNPQCEVDPRPGGVLNIDMQAPDGTIFPMSAEFLKVQPEDVLVFSASAMDGDGKYLFTTETTVKMDELDNQTSLTVVVRVTFMTEEAKPYLAGQEQGWNMSFDKLEEYLGSLREEA